MKKSFMTRVLAVSLSAAMAFSMSSASNLMTASAASTVNLKTTFKTLKVNQTYKMTLKNNTLNWKITKVSTSNKKICTVYGKTASSVMLKGKGVGRAKITVKVKTAKRKYPKNIKNMKCTVNVKAAADQGQTTEALSATAVANSNAEVSVSFNQAIDAAEAANFTVSDNVSVTKAELSADKKRVLLTIAGAEYGKNYNLTVSGIKVGGKEQAEQKLTFTTPAAQNKYPMTLEAKDTVLKSDGQDQTLITFTISDENGKLITDKGVEVAFTASLGKFAEQRVSIQDGKATVMYTSEALKETQSAKITATVVEVQAGSNQELMGLSTTTTVTLTPNPGDTSIGAMITSATAPTADRIIAYFDREVKASDFKTASGKIDRSKFTYEIISGLDNDFVEVNNTYTDDDGKVWGYKSLEHEIVGILDVDTSEKNALQLLVNTPMRDNSNVRVKFRNKNNTNDSTVAENTVYFKLTDARQPAVLSTTPNGLRELKIEFSEAVLPGFYGNKPFAADNPANYTIDGLSLTDYWDVEDKQDEPEAEKPDSVNGNIKKDSEKDAEVTNNTTVNNKDGSIKVGSYKDGEDTRHVVTIKVGREKYLKPGMHSISISNVGDWAAWTDSERNIVNTETFDFEVASDDLVPTFEVTPQSPEQYLVTFNTDVDPVYRTSDTIKTPNSSVNPSLLRLQQNIGGSWVDISDSDADTGKNPIRVSKVKNSETLYIVEVLKDWTEVYNTIGTRSNYFNAQLRLHMDAGTIVNLKNDKRNAEINIPLEGDIMRSADVVSPEISEVTQAVDDNDNPLNSYNVTLSEPVKLSNGYGTAVGANKEGLTPSQTQSQNSGVGNLGVPAPSAQFIRADNGLTVDGIISDEAFIDAYDKIINVEPSTALTAGDWRLVISSISDDYGNTASTLAHPFTVTGEDVTSDFEVVWAAVSNDPDYTAGGIGQNGRYIFVKFNKPITRAGNSTNALVTANYTINGSTLPTGTKITAHIKGYDDHQSQVVDSITITLPTGNSAGGWNNYFVNGKSAMLNISKAITCTTGATLANGGMIRMPFQYGAAPGSDADVIEIDSLDASSDAVFGNHKTEIFGADESTASAQDYYKKLKAALESNKYRRVILTNSLDFNNTDVMAVFGRSHTLTINRAVDIDLRGNSISNANVVVNTTDVVDSMVITGNNPASASITGNPNNRQSTPTLKVTAGNIKHFTVENVTIEASGQSDCAIDINDTWYESFRLNAPVTGNVAITDANAGRFAVLAGGSIDGKVLINTSGDITLGDLPEGMTVEVNQPAVIRIMANLKDVTLNVMKGSKDARVIVNNSVNPELEIHAYTEVRVTIPAGKGGIKCITETGGKFTPVTADNKALSASVSKDEAVDVNDSQYGYTEDSPIKDALEKLNVLTCKVDGTVPETVTWGAISGSGIDTNVLVTQIAGITKDSQDRELGTTIKAEYTLVSTSVATMDKGVIKGKKKDAVTKGGKDTVSVKLTCGQQTVTKYIYITDK